METIASLTQEHVKKICNLIQLDIDAVEAYQQALNNIEEPEIYSIIAGFRDDHKRHVTELSSALKDFGHEPPAQEPDLKGYLLKGLTALRSVTGTMGALKAMHSNEELTNKKYNEALGFYFPDSIQAIIERNFADEQRHLHYIDEQLNKNK